MVTTLMELAGFVSVVVGCGLFSVPLAFIVAGVMLILAGVLIGRP